MDNVVLKNDDGMVTDERLSIQGLVDPGWRGAQQRIFPVSVALFPAVAPFIDNLLEIGGKSAINHPLISLGRTWALRTKQIDVMVMAGMNFIMNLIDQNWFGIKQQRSIYESS